MRQQPCRTRTSDSRNAACLGIGMTLKKQMKRHLGKKATRRIYLSAPWLGTALAVAAGVALRRRGVRGALDDIRGFLPAQRSETSASVDSKGERDLVGSR